MKSSSPDADGISAYNYCLLAEALAQEGRTQRGIGGMSKLPKGWTVGTLQDLAKIRNGYAFKSKDFAEEGVPLIRQSNLVGDRVEIEKAKRLPSEFFEEHERFSINKGDVLIGMSGSIGKLSWYRHDEPALQNQRTGLLQFEEPDSKGWVCYFLNSVERQLNQIAKGVAVQNISAKEIEALEMPIPPLPEQRRIVARIEELFSRLAAGVAALRHAKAQLQRYRQSVLAAAVTGQLTQAWREQHGVTLDDWHRTTLGNESSLVTSGSRGWAKFYADEGPLFIRAQNIKTDALVLDDLAHVQPPAGSEGKRTQVFEHDLLITITGANVTKSAVVKDPLGEAYVSQHVALVRPSNPSHAAFLYYAIISPRNGRAFLEEKAYGAGKPGLNLTNVREVPIGLPPLDEQHQIVAEVEARTTAIDHLEAELDRKITRSNRLRQSTLSAAFAGNLI